jgi:hypothetical protein
MPSSITTELDDVRESRRPANRLDLHRLLHAAGVDENVVAADGLPPELPKPFRDEERDAPRLDARRSGHEPGFVERGREGAPELSRRVGRPLVVVRAVRPDASPVARGVRVEIRHNDDGIVGPKTEEGGHGGERIRDRPVLEAKLEDAQPRQRLGMGDDGLMEAGRLEGGTKAIEKRGGLHASEDLQAGRLPAVDGQRRAGDVGSLR